MEGISPERTTYVNVVVARARAASGRRRGRQAACARPDRAATSSCTSCPSAWTRSRRGSPTLLAGVAEVRKVEELLAEGLFGPNITEALTSRLANLVVLPTAGEAAYWLEEGRFEQRFLGQHGGLSANEMEIPLVSWVAGD